MPNIRDKDGKLRNIAKLQGNFPAWTITGADLGPAGTEQDLRHVLTAIFGQPGLIISELIVEKVCYPDSDLDLRGITSKSSLRFRDCSFRKLQLADASLRSLYIAGGQISEIEGTRLKLSGSFDMSPDGNKPSNHAVEMKSLPTGIDYLELSGAEIGGNLDLENVTILGKNPGDISPNRAKRFSASERLALRADGIKVRGNLFLRDLSACGGLRINGCDIGRNVDLQRTKLENTDGYAVSIAGGEIKGDLSFRLFPKEPRDSSSAPEGRTLATAKGTIRLNNSKIVGRVYLSDLCVEVASGDRDQDWRRYGIEAEGLEIGATLHTDNLTLDAPLNLEDAVLKGGWIGEGIDLLSGAAPALIATGLEVAGLVYLRSLCSNSFLSCVRAEFRGGLVLKDIDFIPNDEAADLPASAHGGKTNTSTAATGNPYPTLNNWRGLKCGLNLDRTTVLGSFELEAVVLRSNESPHPRHGPARDRALDGLKRCWRGGQTWLCLDGATIPEIDKEAFDSFKEFDFVDLMNCTYKSVVTRESDQEPASGERVLRRGTWRKTVQDVRPLDGVSALFKHKRQKLIDVWSAAESESDLPHPFLDAPKVKDWLKVLDSEYAPLARRREEHSSTHPNVSDRDWRPRWAQRYGKLRLAVAALLNGLLLLCFRLPYVLALVTLILVAAVGKQVFWAVGTILAVCLVDGLIILIFDVATRVLRPAAKDNAPSAPRTPGSAPAVTKGSLRNRLGQIASRAMPTVGWFLGLGHDTRFAERLSFLLRYDYDYRPASQVGGRPGMLEVPVFHPQPYLQLARTMRDAGFDRHAAEVIIAMEWRRTWYGDLSPGQKALQYIKGWFLEFGFNRMRPIKWQFFLIVLSTLVFQMGYYDGAIVPAKSNEGELPQTTVIQCPPTPRATCRLVPAATSGITREVADLHSDSRAYVQFNALLFAAETILPLADFGQKKNWIVEPVAGYQQEVQDQNLTSAEFWPDLAQSVLPWWPASVSQPEGQDPTLWHDRFWKNDFWKTFSFHVVALWALFATVFGSLMTTLFVAGILGVITPKY